MLAEHSEAIVLDESPRTPRTTECTAVDGVVSYDVTRPPYGAKGDGETDDITAIQAAIDAASLRAATIPGSCTVEVYFPSGEYHVSRGIYVPSRVALRGHARQSTFLIKTGEGSLIELTERTKANKPEQCAGVDHISVSSLTLEMRTSLHDTSKPLGIRGHCIRSPAGAQYLELRDLKLSSCHFYGLGFQVVYSESGTYDCRKTSRPYEHVTIDGVNIVRAGSDAIDFKQPNRHMNDDIELHRVCVGDIGWNDDDASAAAFDIAGNDVRLSTVTHVNPVTYYDTSGTRAYVSGIRFRSGERNVTNSLVENFRVACVNKGVVFEGQDNRNITLKDGDVREARTVDDKYGDGILVRGSHHHTQGDVHVTEVSRFKLVDFGTDSSMSLSDTAPATYNPACEL